LGYVAASLVWGIAAGIALALMALFMRAPRIHEASVSASAQRLDHADRPALALQTPAFWVLYGLLVMIAVVSPIIRTQFFAIANELKIPRESLGLIYPISTLGFGLSQPFFGWIADRFGLENSMGAAFALAAVTIAAFWVLPEDQATFSLIYCVEFFAAGAATVLFPVACTDLFGRPFAATNYGLLHTAKGVGMLLGSAANVALVATATNWTAVAAVAVLNLIGVMVAVVVLKPLANRQSLRAVGR
jgi:OFA family oxalate/formate antiporter-like MFS transporter